MKIKNFKFKNCSGGFTYVELIVVLSIFSIFSGMAIFNYRTFQGRVDIKNLANEMALQIVEAQKNALNGKIPPLTQQSGDLNWKPSYGVYFNRNSGVSTQNIGDKVFYYFVDSQPKDSQYDQLYSCPASECLDKISITKGNYISAINGCTGVSCSPSTNIDGPLSITFTRPNSGPIFYTSQEVSYDYIRITLSSANSTATYVKIYPSGRVELSDN